MVQSQRNKFYEEAEAAVRAGLLTPREVAIIARLGTRKQRYWTRHVRDLRAVIGERRGRGAN